MERSLIYFVADVHLGLRLRDPQEREERFLQFLRSLPRERTKALYLLGDIWDFWYEYRDVVPREGFRVLAALTQLMEAGVEVFFMEGNHDMWTYSFFERLGIRKLSQPAFVTEGPVCFCLGHGDALGVRGGSYLWLQRLFHSRAARAFFSCLHPRLAFALGRHWSGMHRESREAYRFRGKEEPLYRYAERVASERKVDCFIFGHYHDGVRTRLPGGATFLVLPDWMQEEAPFACFDAANGSFSLHYAVRDF